jgi:hypothetical protein
VAPVLAATLGIVVVTLARWGPDWPAQEFRGWLAINTGLSTWTNSWYGGEPLPGYSVLYPPLSELLGIGLTGLLAVTISAWAAGRLVSVPGRWCRLGYQVSVAIGLTESLLIGQIPFLVGVAFGAGALIAVTRQRPWLTAVLAASCSLSSPLSGAFLLLAAPAVGVATSWRRATPLLLASSGIVVSMIVGGGGPYPCRWQDLAAVGIFAVLVVALTTPADRAWRCLAGCYLVAAATAFVLPNPIGGNITRLGKLIALPMVFVLLQPHRAGLTRPPRIRRRVTRWLVAATAATLWPLVPFVSAIDRGAADPSQYASYYTGLLTFLHTQPLARGRLEIPFTREHWESLWVAKSFPLARGWERQTDLKYNRVLYRPLTAAGYRRWLDANSVSLVALPNVPIDFGGDAEADLLTHPPPYLQPVWHDANWQVWRVKAARPLVSGGATLQQLGPASFTLGFARPGRAIVRIHANGLWEITSGRGCLASTASGWIQVYGRASGSITARARLNDDVVTGLDGCRQS